MTTYAVNLTPHDVNVYGSGTPDVLDTENSTSSGPVLVLPRAETPARVDVTTTEVNPVTGIPVIEERHGDTTGLPAPKPNRVYVVSRTVAERNPHRVDLRVVARPVRDPKGRVIGCRALAQLT